MYFRWKDGNVWIILLLCYWDLTMSVVVEFNDEKRIYYREKVRSMFYHAYNGYLNYAYPLDELRPLTCAGMNTQGGFSLTLIDSLDTLAIMGNYTEFSRAVDLVLKNVDADANVNVSVFETNIRVVGGLLSAHMLAGRVPGYTLHAGWPCAGSLLDLAERFVLKLLPAFNTETGMPFGSLNLKYGVHQHETPITCTACIGSFILEFGTLSRLTGNPHYERVALKALKALWDSKSSLGLVGNHINVKTGVWTATDAGIGSGVDSYFEYLVKGGLLFQRPLLIYQFNEYEKAINRYIRKEDWFVWVTMTKGQLTLPVFQSLEAYWPGVLALLGKVEDASRIILNYNQIVRQFGLLPEFYNLQNHEAQAGRSGYPLRPEIVESFLYLHQATGDPNYLHMAASIVETIQLHSKTRCGYATIFDVTDFTLEDRMESFFLSETTKYLYLLFDKDNFIHNDGSTARVVETTGGSCLIDAGGYIFNTEAHPIDPAILYCCGKKRQNDTEILRRFEENIDFLSLLDISDNLLPHQNRIDLNLETVELKNLDKELSILTPVKKTLIIENHNNLSNDTNNLSKTENTIQESNLGSTNDDDNPKLSEIVSSYNENIQSVNSKLHDFSGKLSLQATCDDCCELWERWHESIALKKMLNVQDSICLLSLEMKEQQQKLQYRSTLPDVDSTEGHYTMDGVKEYSFNSFAYKTLANERFHLLTSPPQSFAVNFVGLGQVVPMKVL